MYFFSRRNTRYRSYRTEGSALNGSLRTQRGIEGRAGGSSGGGGGGRGGSSGSSGSSGSRGSTGSSGSSSSSLSGSSTLRGGSSSSSSSGKLTTSGSAGYAGSGAIWGRSSPFGTSTRPSYPYTPIYGFWPIYWVYDYPSGATPTNDTRPGGDLISAAFTAPLDSSNSTLNITYIIYGDAQSIEEVLPKILGDCQGVNRTTGYDAARNSTLQLYREDSFELLGVGLDAQDRNTSFEGCVNSTIAYNLPVLDSGVGRAISPIGALWVAVILLCLSMLRL